jgi:hypothetical protein
MYDYNELGNPLIPVGNPWIGVPTHELIARMQALVDLGKYEYAYQAMLKELNRRQGNV